MVTAGAGMNRPCIQCTFSVAITRLAGSILRKRTTSTCHIIWKDQQELDLINYIKRHSYLRVTRKSQLDHVLYPFQRYITNENRCSRFRDKAAWNIAHLHLEGRTEIIVKCVNMHRFEKLTFVISWHTHTCILQWRYCSLSTGKRVWKPRK